MRLIDADAFKDYIRCALKDMRHLFKDNGEWAEEVTEEFCKDIDEQPTIELQHWIPCSERLPEVGTTVLITKKSFKIKGYGQEVVKAKRSIDPRSGEIEWWSPEFGTLTDKVVLAWLPLPEPWKGESDG